eukprot:Selendium_serpulae@DN6053_c0_g1_i2.p1
MPNPSYSATPNYPAAPVRQPVTHNRPVGVQVMTSNQLATQTLPLTAPPVGPSVARRPSSPLVLTQSMPPRPHTAVIPMTTANSIPVHHQDAHPQEGQKSPTQTLPHNGHRCAHHRRLHHQHTHHHGGAANNAAVGAANPAHPHKGSPTEADGGSANNGAQNNRGRCRHHCRHRNHQNHHRCHHRQNCAHHQHGNKAADNTPHANPTHTGTPHTHNHNRGATAQWRGEQSFDPSSIVDPKSSQRPSTIRNRFVNHSGVLAPRSVSVSPSQRVGHRHNYSDHTRVSVESDDVTSVASTSVRYPQPHHHRKPGLNPLGALIPAVRRKFERSTSMVALSKSNVIKPEPKSSRRQSLSPSTHRHIQEHTVSHRHMKEYSISPSTHRHLQDPLAQWQRGNWAHPHIAKNLPRQASTPVSLHRGGASSVAPFMSNTRESVVRSSRSIADPRGALLTPIPVKHIPHHKPKPGEKTVGGARTTRPKRSVSGAPPMSQPMSTSYLLAAGAPLDNSHSFHRTHTPSNKTHSSAKPKTPTPILPATAPLLVPARSTESKGHRPNNSGNVVYHPKAGDSRIKR